MATKFYSVPLVVDFPHWRFLVPEIFWQAIPFLSNEGTELCCPIHKWSSNIFWIFVVVQVVRQSLLGHHRFAIWFIVINGVHQNVYVLLRLIIMHWITNRNRRWGVATVKGNCFETQIRWVYKESPVQSIVINIECLHQAINISASNKAPFHFKEMN